MISASISFLSVGILTINARHVKKFIGSIFSKISGKQNFSIRSSRYNGCADLVSHLCFSWKHRCVCTHYNTTSYISYVTIYFCPVTRQISTDIHSYAGICVHTTRYLTHLSSFVSSTNILSLWYIMKNRPLAS